MILNFSIYLAGTVISTLALAAGLDPGTSASPQCTYACGAIDILQPCPDGGFNCNCDVILAQAAQVYPKLSDSGILNGSARHASQVQPARLSS
jgi:hypothetical protein